MSLSRGLRVAVVGATGNVGRAMCRTLAEREFPIDQLIAVASERSLHKTVSFGDEDIPVQSLNNFSFTGVDLALFSAGSDVAKLYAPLAARQGCVVIDNSTAFRDDEQVPLVVPEVNPKALKQLESSLIIANPNCAVIQLVVALNPLHKRNAIKRIVVTSLQSVSGAGRKAMDELYNETRQHFMGFGAINKAEESKKIPRKIAFNLVPQIGDFDGEGYSGEEVKVENETQKLLGSQVAVTATCIRVPVFVGHSQAINVEFSAPITAQEAYEVLGDAPGVILNAVENLDEYFTPIQVPGSPYVYVSRLRQDFSHPAALNMWVIADNLQKGAALNAVQIAELLLEQGRFARG